MCVGLRSHPRPEHPRNVMYFIVKFAMGESFCAWYGVGIAGVFGTMMVFMHPVSLDV